MTPNTPSTLKLPLNMDFDQRIAIDTLVSQWLASPKPGVWRKPLAREDAEQGHATSIVRYDPGASFHAHDHPGGEEILVLRGTFSDETGNYGAGTYFRNPEGFRHAPFSEDGCEILVKLHQFDEGDTSHVVADTHSDDWQTLSEGMQKRPLHQFGDEQVYMLRVNAGVNLRMVADRHGEEIYILHGRMNDEYGEYGRGAWIRSPNAGTERYVSENLLAWVKTGHFGE
ncbi:Uncharacterised protein [BD1-7 clade bacterium]|uniref:ChrR-like cupin domain-containing protein n=1 Tax=BD1-7 clade bacterium TaxID=2029982 RepID=A0A5S9QPZ4_9GAMM|nr:Uncharacterised protein [BD1-7 clade bacterium]